MTPPWEVLREVVSAFDKWGGAGKLASSPRIAMPRILATPPRSFDDLVGAVRSALVQGQALADRAYLTTYHRTGQLIAAHLFAHKERADYGAGLIPKLAKALQADERLLYRCLRFYRAFPILANRPELAWAHYRVLIDVADKPQREALAREAGKKHWTSTELESRVRMLNAIDVTPRKEAGGRVPTPRLLTPKRGMPGMCKVITVGEALVVDLGFATYLDLSEDTNLAAGNFVRVTEQGVATAKAVTKADLFTYDAEILKVVDGDTLWVKIYLRPGHWVKQKLRLRDLDCP